MTKLEEKLFDLGYNQYSSRLYTKDLNMGTIYAHLGIKDKNTVFLELSDINFVTSKEDIKAIKKDLKAMYKDLEILKEVVEQCEKN